MGRVLPLAPAFPTLDELAENPARASDLPADVAERLHTRCLLALNALWHRQLGARQPEPARATDVLLTIDDAAQRLSTSRDWLYRHASRLPFAIRNGRQLRFSSEGIARYIRERSGG